MRKLVLIAALLASCASLPSMFVEPPIKVARLPELGEQLSDLPPTGIRTIASSSQTWRSYEAKVNGIAFTIGVDDWSRVHYIATSDESFTSPEGLHRGDVMLAAIKAAPNETVREESGWGTYIRLPSGWYAFIDDSRVEASGKLDLNLGTRPLGSNAVITMFFKRD